MAERSLKKMLVTLLKLAGCTIAAIIVVLCLAVGATGMVFLSQCLAVFVTTIIVIVVPKWQHTALQWLVASFITALLIMGSFYVFYHGPRIVTEADGPQTIGYECLEGESNQTIINLTGNSDSNITDHNLTVTLCVLTNLPEAASNISPIQDDYDEGGIALFALAECAIYVSFAATRALTKRFG